MKYELCKTFKDKKRLLVAVVILILPIIDVLMKVQEVFSDYWMNPEFYPNGLSSNDLFRPSIASFLSGSGGGNICQMLLIWLMPIYIMILYVDSFLQEKENGYSSIYLTKIRKQKVYNNKVLTSFLIVTVLNFVSLLINHVMASVIFYGGEYMRWLDSLSGFDHFFEWCISNDEWAYIIYMLSYSLIVGAYAIFCMNISFLFSDRKIVFAIAVILWIVLVISPYSITYAMQPFTEYGLRYFIVAWLVIAIICLASFFLVKKKWIGKDEI